jgi:transcriptional regulator with XRE-family HTH domain
MYVPATELARRRQQRGLSQRELARRLGIAASTLSSVENSWRPSWPRLRDDCARILDYPQEMLFPPGEAVRR